MISNFRLVVLFPLDDHWSVQRFSLKKTKRGKCSFLFLKQNKTLNYYFSSGDFLFCFFFDRGLYVWCRIVSSPIENVTNNYNNNNSSTLLTPQLCLTGYRVERILHCVTDSSLLFFSLAVHIDTRVQHLNNNLLVLQYVQVKIQMIILFSGFLSAPDISPYFHANAQHQSV